MTVADKYIVDTYSNLFEGLNSMSKIELIEKLLKSLKVERKTKEKAFYKSFGAFESNKSAAEISKGIKDNRKFKREDLKL